MGNTNSSYAPFFASTTLNAPQMRAAMGAIWADSPTGSGSETGVVPSGGNTNTGFTPTSTGTSSNPAVTVAPGQCVLQRPVGGTYIGTLPVAVSVTIDLALPSSGQTRFDVLCARIVDGEADGGTPPQTNTLNLITVTGTPGASPAVPSVPAGYLPLYNIQVTNGGVLTFTDVRIFTRGVGGIRFVSAGDTRVGSYPGDLRVFATGEVDVWVGGAWSVIATPAVWNQFTPVLHNVGSNNNQNLGSLGSAVGRYMIVGKTCHLRYVFQMGSDHTALGWGDITSTLPPGVTAAATGESHILAKINIHNPVGTLYAIMMGDCFINANGTTMALYFPVSNSFVGLHTYQFADNTLAAGTGFPVVPGGWPHPGVLVIQGSIEIQ